jgi:hypothetical protein
MKRRMPWHHRTALVLLGIAIAAPASATTGCGGLAPDARADAVTDACIPQAVEDIVRTAPPSLAYGSDGIDFIAVEALVREQAGYRGEGWGEHWHIVARRSASGDPIFVDASKPGLPVMTAMHGEGEWTPVVVAPSWEGFMRAVERLRAFAVGREHPVALGENPPSDAERQALHNDLSQILGIPLPGMWESMTMSIDD